MGGGDLNLKKSWHPTTMKNQEKVWKAEQAKTEEKRKVDDLRKEIESEKNREELKRLGERSGVLERNDDAKLEWMYKNNELINRDEYLLGRTIDKSFEKLQAEEQQSTIGVKQVVNHVEHECIPFSIRQYRDLDCTEQVDMQRKAMEDPLMLIKQREMESRRKLLENPVKLKELHRLLKTEKDLKSAKKSKKSKKSKKKHKKRSKYTSDTDSDSEKDLDKELEERYKILKGKLHDSDKNLDLSKLLDAKYKTISKELDKAKKQKDTKINKRNRSASRESNNREHKFDSNGRNRRRQREDSPRQQSKHNDMFRNNSRNNQSRSRSPNRRNDRFSNSNTQTIRKRSRTPSRARPNQGNLNSSREQERGRRKKSQSPHKKYEKSGKPAVEIKNKSLSEAEKEERRREMLENAAWREADRTQSVRKHREAYAREEEQNRGRDFDKEFINKEVKKAIANHSSVGSRIRANLNNVQRTSSAMNANFARK